MAPPSFLGHLRDALGDATRQRLRGSLDLDLTKAPLAEIVARLPEHRPAYAPLAVDAGIRWQGCRNT